MKGGTVFNFVDDGIHSALEQAFDAAGGADVRLGGARPRYGNTWTQDWSTNCISPSHPC